MDWRVFGTHLSAVGKNVLSFQRDNVLRALKSPVGAVAVYTLLLHTVLLYLSLQTCGTAAEAES